VEVDVISEIEVTKCNSNARSPDTVRDITSRLPK